MKTGLTQSHFLVTPGQPTRVEIEVTNTADVIDGITAIVDGINPDWIRLERPMLSLFPDSTDRIALVFDIPTNCPAGDYLVIVRIVSTIDHDRESVHDFWLTVGVVAGVDLTLRPSIVTGGSEAMLEASITNTGNAAAGVTVTALEPTRAVDCKVDPHSFVLGPGAPAVLPILLRGPRPWFGQPAARQIHITAEIDEHVVERIATFNQKPRVPRGVITALTLAGIVLLWALIFLWVISELRSGESAEKAVGTYLIGGPDNIPLDAIAGTVEGTVTASTTGDPLPRITVEALRITAQPAGAVAAFAAVPAAVPAQDDQLEDLELIGSAATDDDGVYSLPTLIPGEYKLRFSADGFGEAWYVDDEGVDRVEVTPKGTVPEIDMVMTGQLGQITGNISLPPGSEGVPLQVTATMQLEQGGSGEAATAEQTTTDGTIRLDGLPTPATYLVTVSGPGFQSQQFEQTVGGGEASVLNTVNMTAADGTIEGIVVDGNGFPLGGVEVTARSGTVSFKATTPTSGQIGTFRFVGLATPETYVLTFLLDGFSSETRALTLGAGATTTLSPTLLIGGSGTITGLATTPEGAALGGITVEVAGDAFTGETSTLTTTGAGGAAGSFTITGLPVPGEYTITFSGSSVQSETLAASFPTAGTQDIGAVVLLPLTSEIRGTVRAGGAGLGEVDVVLSDGNRSQATTSATNPPGSYTFANVLAGSYTITFTRAGYGTQVVLVRVEAGVDAVRDVSLVAGAAPPPAAAAASENGEPAADDSTTGDATGDESGDQTGDAP